MSKEKETTVTFNLNYFHLLTLVFVTAKLFDKIDWSWFYVFLPSIISVGLGILFWTIMLLCLFLAGPGKR